jgi:hypothetical protein
MTRCNFVRLDREHAELALLQAGCICARHGLTHIPPMKALVHGLMTILSLGVTAGACADPPVASPAARAPAQQPNYTLYCIRSIGNAALVVHSCLTPTRFTVNTNPQTVVIRPDGTPGTLGDLKVGQWVKLYGKGDRNSLEHAPIVRIELSARGPAATGGPLGFDTFSGYFVSNKFEPDAAESFVVIRDRGQFDKIFGTAMVMGDQSHRLPDDAFKSNIVLAAIKRGGAVWKFNVQGISATDGLVELRYTATATKSRTATFACPLVVSIPQGAFAAIQFVENGKAVKKLKMSER